jgi:hypothetical protein
MRCISALVCTVFLLLPQTARAEHGPPTATSVDELVEELAGDLEALAAEYGFGAGDQPGFDEPQFNRLVGFARVDLEHARLAVDRGDVCLGLAFLGRSVWHLDTATHFAQLVGMSGSGYSDDLAGLNSFRAETFYEDLIVLAPQEAVIPPAVLELAEALEELADDFGLPGEEANFAGGLRFYTAGVCLLFPYL